MSKLEVPFIKEYLFLELYNSENSHRKQMIDKFENYMKNVSDYRTSNTFKAPICSISKSNNNSLRAKYFHTLAKELFERKSWNVVIESDPKSYNIFVCN
jgi:hypothetical protein